ncbi:hypothetical protein GPLA_4369 [Paraglaciecola polaris LMG 21857]|uniref:Uncharacterized protein n=1 Tax=Paraglaciecola polaris LMG 21857 TaxID=1129793 RepID=K7A2V7_9ALTE|nr:hypothetical protein GPLA_4369 [Paraglaciecola polaris LMG 21857]
MNEHSFADVIALGSNAIPTAKYLGQTHSCKKFKLSVDSVHPINVIL